MVKPQYGTESADGDEGEAEGIDLQRVLQIAGFVTRAPRRHPLLAIVVFVTVASLGLALAAVTPNTYRASVKLQVQRSLAIRALTSTNEKLQQIEWESPTKDVQGMILRRDNLVALAKEANLVERFYQTRPASLRFKDKIMAYLSSPPSDDDKLKGMVYTLESRLTAEAPDDTTVIISVDWTNPAIAYELVTLVQKNFEEARYDSDVAVIKDSVAVLEEHAKAESAHVDAEIVAYQKTVAERVPASRTPGAAARAPGFSGVRSAPGAGPAEVADLDAAKALEAKRMEISALEAAHQQAITTVRQQLVQAQLTLTPLHPTVMALQKQLDALSQPPPELAAAQADERALMAQIAPPRPAVAAPAAAVAAPPRHVSEEIGDAAAPEPPSAPRGDPNLDGPLRLAESKLTAAIHSYEDSIARIDSTRAELDIARAAYKHRYTVVTPAELPERPKRRMSMMIGVGSLVGAVVLALLLSALADFAKGTIVEPWQVPRALKVEVLCELDRPS